MESDSEKENYFSIYMKKKKNEQKKSLNSRTEKKSKSIFIQNMIEDNSKMTKYLLESYEKSSRNNFSLIKSYLSNFQEKIDYESKIKNMVSNKQICRSEAVNKSSLDIKLSQKYPKSNAQNKIQDKNINKKICNNNNSKIEKLQGKIFSMINLIDNFEKKFIQNGGYQKIKDEFKKIQFNSDKGENVINKKIFNLENSNISKTERNENKINKINYIDDSLLFNLHKYNKNNINSKNIITNKKEKNEIESKKYKKNGTILIYNNNNLQQNTKDNHSIFMKLISLNSNKISKNNNLNKGHSLAGRINSNSTSNKLLNKNDKSESKIEINILKRRINYSNLVKKRMKKNIVNRNKDTTFKQNKQFNSNNSKIKLSPCKNLNKEYYNLETIVKVKSFIILEKLNSIKIILYLKNDLYFNFFNPSV